MTAHSAQAAVVTVVIVDDSAVQRRFVRSALADDPSLEVVGEARNGRDAIALVERLRPSAVLMDLHLPVMNGIEAIERIMAVRPTPIVVYSSFVDGDDRDNASGAIAAGAIDVMAKPAADSIDLTSYAQDLRQRLRVAGRVRVITHPRGRLNGATGAQVSTRRLGGPAMPRQRPSADPARADGHPGSVRRDTDAAPARRDDAAADPVDSCSGLSLPSVDLLVIGASTGGPQALASLLSQVPADSHAALLVVQHMADGFMEGLAGWLDAMCPLPVAVGQAGRRLQPGTVTIAPSGLNLIVHDQMRVTTHEPPPSQYHVPGVDATFQSVAESHGPRSGAVLLTGMGRDGALGMRAIREAGGFTIAQDEATCAVYGMPAAAMAIDAAVVQLPLPVIADAVARMVAAPAERGGAS